ncbi:immunoglobulin-like receptor CHIR-B4 isoform X2 [Gallus gallus]|uniref:immunoglobulin-like receptor CHIR-B4 isoform X2 n=1 Tax=Gallus gallus TaxID=9031 RepID=UPI001AE78B55|nr:immunoglobulin-like receptor CHIR-B4 isoform X2 [Gallus gallus]XP_046789997.1 immunoglobulin-like receptor CHIR-B4 isoform X2 [Gallus gallus]
MALLPWKRKAALGHFLSLQLSHCPQAAPASWHQWRWPSSWVSDHGDVVPRGLVAQCGTRTVSLAGWWLVAASRAQQLPRPSLSLHPSQGVSLGDTVTLCCHLPQPAARVELYQEEKLRSSKEMDQEHDVAEFSLAGIKQEDAVRYQCQYQGLEPVGTSEKSDPVELLVTDHRYPPPGISLGPREYVEMETNITIQCWNQQYGGTIFLHKDGHSAPIQHQEPDGGGTATFILFGVTPADSGTYRCSYHVGGSYLLSSPLGDNVTLEVIPRPAPPGATSRSPEAVQFQVSPGDSEGLTYAQLQAVTPSTHPPGSSTTFEPPIIYAEVGTRGPR